MKKEQKEIFEKLSELIVSDPRRIRVLSEMIYAILYSRNLASGELAGQIGRDVKDSSIVQMLRRFYKNEHVTWEIFYAPLISELLKSYPDPISYLLIDTTDVGQNHRAVVLSLAYKKRSLPLIWHVEPGSKGHSSEKIQLKLLKKLTEYVQLKGTVIFLGDSEFSGVSVLNYVEQELNWYYVCRAKPSRYVWLDDETGHPLTDLMPKPGCSSKHLQQIAYTTKHLYQTDVFACWDPQHKDPLILLYHLPLNLHPRVQYRPRFFTEPLFGDCKEAGLRLNTSRLQHPQRLERLFLACAVSYIWMVALGAQVIHQGLSHFVDRSHRRTLSIFKTGWRWFKRRCKLHKFVPFSLQLPAHFHLVPT